MSKTQDPNCIEPTPFPTPAALANDDHGFGVYNVYLGRIASSYEVRHADSWLIYGWCGYNARMSARSLMLQSQMTSILSHSVISTDLATGSRNWNVSLDEGLDKSECRGYSW